MKTIVFAGIAAASIFILAILIAYCIRRRSLQRGQQYRRPGFPVYNQGVQQSPINGQSQYQAPHSTSQSTYPPVPPQQAYQGHYVPPAVPPTQTYAKRGEAPPPPYPA
jgi:hypothetical protein